MRRTITIISASLCALFLSCCRCDWGCKTVTYRVEGEAGSARVEYHNEYEDKEGPSSVKIPWEKSFNIQFRSKEYYGGGARRDNYTAYISAGVFDRPAFPVKVLIYVDGELVRSDSTTSINAQASAYYLIRYCD